MASTNAMEGKEDLAEKKRRGREDEKKAGDWRLTLGVAVAVGVLVLVGYAGGQSERFLTTACVALMVSGAGLMVGGLVGFVFGIPRSATAGGNGGNGDTSANGNGSAGGNKRSSSRSGNRRYSANTNLEQISDWLSKILVGVGLTQLSEISSGLAVAAEYVGRALASTPAAEAPPAAALGLAYGSLVFFPTCGFLFAYLWTRIYLESFFSAAESAAEEALAKVEEVEAQFEEQSKQFEEQSKQLEADRIALARVTKHLSGESNGNDGDGVPETELAEVIRNASSPTKAQIFYLSEKIRTENWREKKPLMARTIPIFRALIACDVEQQYHKNYAKLGYALKDREPPDWSEALTMLDTAIAIRDRGKDRGRWRLYELNRALCRIALDTAKHLQAASSNELCASVLADLEMLHKRDVELLRIPEIASWLKRNRLSEKDVKLR